jgi:signal transduction histidine kinase
MRAHRGIIAAACGAVLLLASSLAVAAGHGTAEEAKAMLERAVAAMKADKAKALAEFNRGEAGFRDRDLYVFCATTNGTVDAHVDPTQIGRKLQDQYDVDGVAFGQEMMAVAREGQITEVAYMWPRPDSPTPAEKVSFVTRVANQICGVGYYK